MPTNSKPRKNRAASHEVAPGQIWTDLIALHHNCLSMVQSGAAAAPILKDPTFIENTENIGQVTAVTKSIASKLPVYVERLNILKSQTTQARAQWDLLDAERRTASKARDLARVNEVRSQMDNVEFASLSIGEQYQSWLAEWQEDVAIEIIVLLNLIEETRRNMEKKQNATE